MKWSSRLLLVLVVAGLGLVATSGPAYAVNPTVDNWIYSSWVGASPTINVHPSRLAGDLLILQVTENNSSGLTHTVPAGWARLFASNGTWLMEGFYRYADGNEAATMTVNTLTGNNGGAAVMFIVRNYAATPAPEAACAAGNSTLPNPPNLDPAGWGVEDSFYMGLSGHVGSNAVTVYPSNLTQMRSGNTATWSSTFHAGQPTVSPTTSMDPGTFTTSSSNHWRGCTVAIKGGTSGGGGGSEPPPGTTEGDTFIGGLLGGVSGLLNSILCVLRNLALSIIGAIIMAFNAVIVALASVIRTIVQVLPGFPALPPLPAEFDTAAGWMAWVFPVSTVVSIVAWFGAIWLLWQAVAIGLRWAKALNG